MLSLDTGRTLFEENPERRMSPASNCKLYPVAMGFAILGGDYRIRTPLLAGAAPDGSGVLNGDLVIAGRGDPSWKSAAGADGFWAAFDPFVTALRRAGVRRIKGGVVADSTWLRSPPHGASWTVDDMNFDYGAELSAVSLNDNYVELRIRPGALAGQPCKLELAAPLTGLVLENLSTTVAAGGQRHLRVQRLPGESRVQIYGQLPLGSAEEVTEITVPRPAAWFAAGLTEALRRAGILVEGKSRAVLWPDSAPQAGVVLGEVTSPPLREMLSYLLRVSQNLETDLIFAHIGESSRLPDTPEWERSDELGVKALEVFLRQHDLRPGEVDFEEGSGLSRNNMASAAAITRLLQYMAGRPDGADFQASLPTGGSDGTLRRRLKNLPPTAQLRAKTGSLKWAAALSGYVTTAAGEHLCFSLILNRYHAEPGHKAGEELDEIVNLLAGYHGQD